MQTPARLGLTLMLSILLHAAAIEGLTRLAASTKRDAQEPALAVRLRDVPKPAAEPPASIAPRLPLPKESQPNASAAPPTRPRDESPRPDRPVGLSGAAARVAHSQVSRALNYPREAVEQGLEGQATVLIFLDAAGSVIAARLEASSGHALLDDAAVRAARTIRDLPDSAPREALLPVRFRLR
jgi:protein TonB